MVDFSREVYMKRTLLIVLIFVMLFMCSCKSDFSFRDNRFGDSIGQVQKTEGESGEIVDGEDAQYLHFSEKEFLGSKGHICYVFQEDKLQHIMFNSNPYDNIDTMEQYNRIKGEFAKYGSPDEESKEEDRGYRALWKEEGYGIVLVVVNGNFLAVLTSDPDKSEKFFNTMNFTDLTKD